MSASVSTEILLAMPTCTHVHNREYCDLLFSRCVLPFSFLNYRMRFEAWMILGGLCRNEKLIFQY